MRPTVTALVSAVALMASGFEAGGGGGGTALAADGSGACAASCGAQLFRFTPPAGWRASAGGG